jgi:hypothetical protein
MLASVSFAWDYTSPEAYGEIYGEDVTRSYTEETQGFRDKDGDKACI